MIDSRIPSLLLPILISLFIGLAPAHGETDARGKSFSFEEPPQRILSLAPSITEMLYALGLGPRIVGVTEFSDEPPEAKMKPRIGSFVHLNLERALSLRPDLAIGTMDGNARTEIGRLERAGVRVFLLNPRTVPEMLRALVQIGRLCGAATRATRLARGISEDIHRLTAPIQGRSRPRVFLQLSAQPLISANGNTYLNDLIERAGGINVMGALKPNYPRVSLEAVLQAAPDLILISSPDPKGAAPEARAFWSRWRVIPAVRTGRIHLVDSDLLDRPSPRVVETLKRLIALFHPDDP